MVTKNSIDSNIPIEISKGGTNATSMSTNTGIVKYDGTSLVTSTTALIDSSNRMTNTAQPAFLGVLETSKTNATGNTTVVDIGSLTEIFDQGGNFDPVSGIFTAPVTGKYFLCGAAQLNDATALTEVDDNIDTSNRTYRSRCNYSAALGIPNFTFKSTVLADMDAGDTARYKVYSIDSGGKIDTIFGAASPDSWTYFCGFLAC